MRLLCFQAKRFWWKTFEKTLADAPTQEVEMEVRDAVVALLHVEAGDVDPEREPSVFRQTLKHLKWLANKRDLRVVVLHSFTHLGGDSAQPVAAQALLERLAQRLTESFGAPDMAAARAAAEEEVTFAASLCSEPQDTLVAVRRAFEDGAVHESFRTLQPRNGPKPARAFSFLEVEGEDDETQPAEQVDLIGMVERERK